MPEPTTYTVVVTQERVKTMTVQARNEEEAEARVREILSGAYGGWKYRYPKVAVSDPPANGRTEGDDG